MIDSPRRKEELMNEKDEVTIAVKPDLTWRFLCLFRFLTLFFPVLLVLLTTCLFMKVSFSPDVIPSG